MSAEQSREYPYDDPRLERVYRSILKQLPVRPRVMPGEMIDEIYVAERQKVASEADLQALVRRWRALWRLPEQRGTRLTYEESLLASGRLRGRPLKYTFRWFERMQARQEGRSINPGRNWRLATHLMIPVPLLHAFQVARHYQVPTDVAMIQLYDGQDLL